MTTLLTLFHHLRRPVQLRLGLWCHHYHHRHHAAAVVVTTTSRRTLISAARPLSGAEGKRVLKKEVKPKRVVPIWKNMTPLNIADNAKRSLDHVFEAMLYVKNCDAYDSAHTPIDDLQVIRDIVKILGMQAQLSSSSSPTGSTTTGTKEKGGGKDKTGGSDDEIYNVQPRPVVEKNLAPRPPVVAIMGHVDHGKTTLLDALRNTRVAASEAGGITQHIGAFVVPVSGKSITFLDTPGHAAFSALRRRGANGADIVVLVVSADDGVMEQTRESIRMIQEAKVPMLVAVNKIDKAGADTERTKKMLLQEGIQLEDFGGEVQAVEISALKGTNLPILVEALTLQAELQNLRSENIGPMEGVVLESSIDTGRGKLCTSLVQRGVLRKGAILVAGTSWAKVRGMFDEHGQPMEKALPSTPVEIIGWRDLPSAGEAVYEVDNERLAKEIIDYRKKKEMEAKASEDAPIIAQRHQEHLVEYKEYLAEKRRLGRHRLKPKGPRQKMIQEDMTIRLPIIIKADVDGSVEALLDVIDTYDEHDQCRLDVVHYGVGDVTETDVKLAEAFQAHIYGFNVKISEPLKKACQGGGVEFRISNVIYRLFESIKNDIGERLPLKSEEEQLGEATVLALFKITDGKKKVNVAGSRCTKGALKKEGFFRIIREEEIIYDGKIHSMKHLKEEVDTITSGVECGLAFDDVNLSLQEGDSIACYKHNQIPQKSTWDPF